MNPWCESCARKNLCYVVDDRPKCFVPITNTASGTPKSYLAKSLLYSRDSHEIAKDEPQCESCINYGVEFTDDDSFDTCLANECHYELQTQFVESKVEDESQTERSE